MFHVNYVVDSLFRSRLNEDLISYRKNNPYFKSKIHGKTHKYYLDFAND